MLSLGDILWPQPLCDRLDILRLNPDRVCVSGKIGSLPAFISSPQLQLPMLVEVLNPEDLSQATLKKSGCFFVNGIVSV